MMKNENMTKEDKNGKMQKLKMKMTKMSKKSTMRKVGKNGEIK